jgi:hypothetical protein
MSLLLNGTNGVSDIDGTAATPAIRGTDTNTGIFFPAADTMAFSDGGVESARFNGSGQLGLGTTNPETQLHLTSTTPPVIRLQTTGTGSAMGLDFFSTSAANSKGGLTVNLGAEEVKLSAGANSNSYFLTFFTNGSERMRLDSTGNFLVNTPTQPPAGSKMNINGGITPSVDNSVDFGTSSYRWQALYAANGTIQTSDQREKTDIIDSPLGLDFICKVKPVAYKFKIGKNKVSADAEGNQIVTPIVGKRQHFGVLAQQVKESLGDVDFGGWVLTDTLNADSPQGIRYDEFIAPLIKAVQELKTELDSVKTELATLKA